MRTRSLLMIGTTCLFLAACGDSGPAVEAVEPRPQPTEKIAAPNATFNQNHPLETTTNIKPPAGTKKKD